MSERLSEYFASESSEYLDQLETLLARPGAPDAQQMLRLARGVSGSAQMAGAQTIAGVAERLEDAARAVISNSIVWDEEVRELAAETVQDLQILVHALNRWGPDEEARVRAAIERWGRRETDSARAVVQISSLFYDDSGPHVVSEPESSENVVPVESLLLRGSAALREALRLRPALERASEGGDSSEIRPLLDELFELVRLGSEADPVSG